MFFKRKAYEKLREWKEKYADCYSILLEGPRRVGKSTIAEQFAKNEYETYILIDFANISNTLLACFDDINDLDVFFEIADGYRKEISGEKVGYYI